MLPPLLPEDRIAAECHCLPLRMLHRAVTAVYDDALRPFDLRAAQMNVLVTVAKMGVHATPALVVKYLAIEKSTLSRDLERMEERGWLKSEARGAGRRLEMTAKGRRLLERVLPAWEAAQAETKKLLGSAAPAIDAAATRLRLTPGGNSARKQRATATDL